MTQPNGGGGGGVIVKAVLVKTCTEDGLVSFRSGVSVGHEYLVDLNTIRRKQSMTHVHDDGRPEDHHKDIIFTWDGVWLPLECLQLP
jgi:hypothetical protein